MKSHRLAIIASATVLVPSVAHANGGSVVMLAGIAHLLFGNIILGVLEGLLLTWRSRAPFWRTIPWMIVANYASMLVGACLLDVRLVSPNELTLLNVRFWFGVFVTCAFLVTLLVEFPFFVFALWKAKWSLWRVARLTLFVHVVSYALLFGWYWSASGTSILTDLDVVPAEAIGVPAGYDLYYIASDGQSILRADLAGRMLENIDGPASTDWDDRLFARRNERGSFDLMIRRDVSGRGQCIERTLRRDFSPDAPIDAGVAEGYSAHPEGTMFNVGAVPRLVRESDWEYYVGIWAVQGIRGENGKTGERIGFSLETPFMAWLVRNAVHVDGDFVVFQLGPDQICILHPQRKQIALVARGRGCLVARRCVPPDQGP